ncbi:macrolide transport system ATP-binding/permease protein [Nonomuraea solani]|uniref:Macrolide transport system ATP-binding/permease protein n=1 Tax=Nonomuraea solani TaxID=1144553 RepID=A0A1H6D3X6_9ACTN|nr:TlrC/CarA/OleB/SrmB family ABC-F type ribosomal protection protein [Nonomuraea solani]SEG79495.1 macrolide transport system ATP-binding/permease protein [Nonomuraea solani]
MRTAAQLALTDITKRYDTRVVLDRVSFTVRPGEKIGVIGDNGSGKSTLLRLMAGVERPDNGELTVVAPGGVGYLPQSLELPPHATVADAIDLALAELRDLESRMRAALAEEAMDVYARLVTEFEARDGYEADARVDAALHGLGLPGLDRARPVGTLSGGERSRLALAATLAAGPELLLLDEPTNDLDDEAVAWLERHLRGHRGTVVAITHDRVFLERVTSTILEVGEGRVRRYGDGYAGYLVAKAAERAAQARAHEDWKEELARHSELVTANAARLAAVPRKMAKAGMGTGAWRARSRAHGAAGRVRQSQQRMRWLTDHPAPPPPEPLRFTASVRAALVDGVVAALDGVRVEGRLCLDALTVRAGERLLVTGPNGAGKTTLMRVLAGELRPDAGTVRRAGRIGYLRQDEPAGPPHRTVLRAYAHGRPGTLDEHADTLLALGLFRPSELGLRMAELSYGQRRRVELARLVSEPVDLLLLDEPTNHLSPMLVEQLEEALASYAGALVVVTHDRRTRAAFTGSHLALAAA